MGSRAMAWVRGLLALAFGLLPAAAFACSYCAARTDDTQRTLLFIGYSMQDLNIRLLLHRLWRMWRDSGRARDRPPSFVFVAERDRVRDAILEQWGITVIAGEEDGPELGLLRFLEGLARDVATDEAPAG